MNVPPEVVALAATVLAADTAAALPRLMLNAPVVVEVEATAADAVLVLPVV